LRRLLLRVTLHPIGRHDRKKVSRQTSLGGIDALLSPSRVGPTGFARGLDKTDEILALALADEYPIRLSGLIPDVRPEGLPRGHGC
jgi:hypothetical protein